MAETVYEGMFLLDSNRYGRDPEAIAGQIPKMIQEAGGTMLVSRLWEERRLAYPVQGRRKGTYWLTYFQLNGLKLDSVRRKCQLNDSILRALFVKIDPRIVDTLVQHALSSDAKPVSGSGESDAPDDDEDAPRRNKGKGSPRAGDAVDEPAEEEDAD